jgi:hypothetical protein
MNDEALAAARETNAAKTMNDGKFLNFEAPNFDPTD